MEPWLVGKLDETVLDLRISLEVPIQDRLAPASWWSSLVFVLEGSRVALDPTLVSRVWYGLP